MKYYKVTTKLMRSTFQLYLPPEAVVTYELGVWTFPRIEGTKLFVYNELDLPPHNLQSLQNSPVNPVFECEVKNPQRVGNISLYPSTVNIIKALWRRYTSLGNITVCDAVKLVKEIK